MLYCNGGVFGQTLFSAVTVLRICSILEIVPECIDIDSFFNGSIRITYAFLFMLSFMTLLNSYLYYFISTIIR